MVRSHWRESKSTWTEIVHLKRMIGDAIILYISDQWQEPRQRSPEPQPLLATSTAHGCFIYVLPICNNLWFLHILHQRITSDSFGEDHWWAVCANAKLVFMNLFHHIGWSVEQYGWDHTYLSLNCMSTDDWMKTWLHWTLTVLVMSTFLNFFLSCLFMYKLTSECHTTLDNHACSVYWKICLNIILQHSQRDK